MGKSTKTTSTANWKMKNIQFSISTRNPNHSEATLNVPPWFFHFKTSWMTEHIAGIVEETLKAKFPKPDFQITRYEQLILTTYIELP